MLEVKFAIFFPQKLWNDTTIFNGKWPQVPRLKQIVMVQNALKQIWRVNKRFMFVDAEATIPDLVVDGLVHFLRKRADYE